MTQATNPAAQAVQTEVYRVTLRCKKHGSVTIAEGVKFAFPCPLCGDPMVYLHDQHKLGGHGKSNQSIDHDLMKVEVTSSVPR